MPAERPDRKQTVCPKCGQRAGKVMLTSTSQPRANLIEFSMLCENCSHIWIDGSTAPRKP